MAHEYRRRRRVEFAETDLAGIAHFSNYYRYMEETEHAFLRSLGHSVVARDAPGGEVGFPRISTRCEYLRPVRFEDEIEIHVWVSRKTRKMIEYSFRISLDGEEAARGQMLAVACRVREGGKLESVPIPAAIDAELEVAPYPPLEFHGDTRGSAR